MTSNSGIAFTYRNGREAGRFYMIESFGGGVAAVDFDRDGDIDLFFTGGGTFGDAPDAVHGLPSALFRNDGNGQFDHITVNAGIAEPIGYSQGCAVTDFDVDGFPDLFVCCYGRSRIYHNAGDGTYREIDLSGQLPDVDWHTTAVFADFDHDGLPDLLIARYADWSPATDVNCTTKGIRDLCPPTAYPATACRAYRNCGDGRFEDWSSQFGMQTGVHGLAIVATDLNLDGLVDIYVASDVTPNQLYLGSAELPLTECGVTAGVAVNEWGQPEGSMGVDVADYDGDGQPDIIVTNFEREDNALYRNLGKGLFLHSTVSAGLAGVSRMRVGFGTALTDFDGDGWPDLFVLNGNPIYAAAETPFKQQSQLFRNRNGRFEDVSQQAGTFFHDVYSGRASAVADLDDDGAPDLVIVPMNDPVRILRNRHNPENFIRVQLAARRGEPDATGAQVSCDLNGRTLVQFVARGTGFFSQSDSRMIFAAAQQATTVDVTVAWPGRSREVFRGLAVRKTHLLIEGRGHE